MLAFLQRNEQGIDIPEGWVKDSTYWLLTESQQIVGAVNIRHELNDKLFNSGGHIGYGIRPGERQSGYGSEILRLSLEKTRELGITRVYWSYVMQIMSHPEELFFEMVAFRMKTMWSPMAMLLNDSG